MLYYKTNINLVKLQFWMCMKNHNDYIIKHFRQYHDITFLENDDQINIISLITKLFPVATRNSWYYHWIKNHQRYQISWDLRKSLFQTCLPFWKTEHVMTIYRMNTQASSRISLPVKKTMKMSLRMRSSGSEW